MARSTGTVPGNAKVIAAWTALVIALSGAIEARVALGGVAERLDRAEKRLDRIEHILEDRYARAD